LLYSQVRRLLEGTVPDKSGNRVYGVDLDSGSARDRCEIDLEKKWSDPGGRARGAVSVGMQACLLWIFLKISFGSSLATAALDIFPVL
jgi:hypothetical protein